MVRLFSAFAFTVLVVVLALSAAITLLMPDIVLIAMFTIIGIPVAIYLMFAPTLFLVAAGAWIGGRLLGGGFGAYLAGAVAALVLMAISAQIANARLQATIDALTAEDRGLAAVPDPRTIAIRVARLGGQAVSDPPCDGFCQRLLLNGVAERVLVVHEDINRPPASDTPAAAYHMERRPACPPVELQEGGDPIDLVSERRNVTTRSADEMMTIEIARGNCLIVGKASLGEADLVISSGAIKRGESEISAGLDLFADTVFAARIAMHERQGAALVETFRQTTTTVYRISHLYMPTVTGGPRRRMHPVLMRTRQRVAGLDLTGFLTDLLGFDLALRRDTAGTETRQILIAALDDDAADAPSRLAGDFFQEIRYGRPIAEADLDLASRLLADPRFAVPRFAWAVVKYAPDAPDSHFDAVAAAMFARLRRFAATGGADHPPWSEQAGYAAAVIRDLPRDTVLRHRADLEWLARQDRVRVPAYGALVRLSEFGADGAATLLWLIDDAWRFDGQGNDWQHPYLAGVIGLCEAGAPRGAGHAALSRAHGLRPHCPVRLLLGPEHQYAGRARRRHRRHPLRDRA